MDVISSSRLYVHQVIASLRASDNSLTDAAEYLSIPEAYVRAAVAYYADFSDEVDSDSEFAASVAAEERDRWERQQQALA